jgi:DNA-binding transcriptional MerR regulator
MGKAKKDIQAGFEIEIPKDTPVFPLNVVCDLLHLHYWTLHEILKEGIVEPKKKGKTKKLFSYKDVKRLKYVKYLIEDKGVNIKGVKVILEMDKEI